MTPVTMLQTRWGYFPKVFVVDGVEHTVKVVERCWITDSRTRFWFRVVCEAGTFDLYRDANQDTWHLAQGMDVPICEQFHGA